MKNILIVFLGGGLGSSVRYVISRLVGSQYTSGFPYATLASNVLACFVLGLLIGLADGKQVLSNNARLFWTVGFCGGFSTFSAFSNETISLFQQGAQMTAAFYVLLSITLSLLAVLLGLALIKI